MGQMVVGMIQAALILIPLQVRYMHFYELNYLIMNLVDVPTHPFSSCSFPYRREFRFGRL